MPTLDEPAADAPRFILRRDGGGDKAGGSGVARRFAAGNSAQRERPADYLSVFSFFFGAPTCTAITLSPSRVTMTAVPSLTSWKTPLAVPSFFSAPVKVTALVSSATLKSCGLASSSFLPLTLMVRVPSLNDARLRLAS